MLDTFTEDRILTAVQELTTELSRLEAKVNAQGTPLIIDTPETVQTALAAAFTDAIIDITTNNKKMSTQTASTSGLITQEEVDKIFTAINTMISDGKQVFVKNGGDIFPVLRATSVTHCVTYQIALFATVQAGHNYDIVMTSDVFDDPSDIRNKVVVNVILID